MSQERCDDKPIPDPALIGPRSFVVSGSFLLDLEHAFMHIREVCEGTKGGPDFTVIPTMLNSIREVATVGVLSSDKEGKASEQVKRLHATTDAVVWAREFQEAWRNYPGDAPELDEAWLVGWFANAIEIGRDAGTRADQSATTEREAARYRWLRDATADMCESTGITLLSSSSMYGSNGLESAEQWDKAIDDAMAQTGCREKS